MSLTKLFDDDTQILKIYFQIISLIQGKKLFFKKMKRIIYFHGLQSKQGGQRIDFLSRKYLVHAPVMIYAEKDTWVISQQKVDTTVPDMIVGSSMGGLMGLHTGYKHPIKLLLFNPAIDRIPEYIPGWVPDSAQQQAEITIVLGRNDTDVSPKFTEEFLSQHKISANILWEDIEHRIPFPIFQQHFKQFEA